MKRRFQSGFTLLELSIVLVVLSVTITVLLPAMDIDRERRRNELLTQQLNQIHDAVLNYRKKNNRLPCPADGTLAQNEADYGIEAADPGDCTTGDPAANFSEDNSVGGVLPTKTLGLPDMLDPWGRRFMYHVDARATRTNAFTRYRMQTSVLGEMSVENGGGGDRTTRAVVVVVSQGRNGHGAYLPSGNRLNAGVTNTQELENCACDSSGQTSTYSHTFVLQPVGGAGSTGVTDIYDDIGFYMERMHLASAGELG